MSTSLSELASLMAEENVTDNETDIDNEIVEENEGEVEEGDESLEETTETEDEGEIETEGVQDEDSLETEATATSDEGDEVYFPETLDDLVSAYEGDEDKLKGITVASKKNGEKVSLGQVLANWEISESATRKSQEASEIKKTLERERAEIHSTMAKKVEEQEAVLEALENLYKTAGSAELEELRQTNPGEYAARKAEFMERDRILEQVKQSIGTKREENKQESQQEFNKNYEQYVQHQNERMLEIIPEWRDGNKFNDEFGEISSYMTTVGFKENEIAGVVDARLRKMARDAMLYNRIATNADPKKKRIVKKPKKVVRAGNANTHTKTDAFKKRMANAARSKDNKVKKAAVAELIFNS